MIRKIIAIVLFIGALDLTVFVNNIFANIGGANYIFLPFPIKVTSCGSAPDVYRSCTYPYIWSGIITSIIFWIIILMIVYMLSKKQK